MKNEAFGSVENNPDTQRSNAWDKMAQEAIDAAKQNGAEQGASIQEQADAENDGFVAQELIALNLDRTASAEEMAFSIAQRELRDDLANSRGLTGWAKKVWKGNLFRGYYVEKNRKKALNEIRDAQDQGSDTENGWVSNCNATMQRFVSEYEDMIHTQAGESREYVDENSEAVQLAKDAIRDFAENQLGKGARGDEAFEAEMKRIELEYLGGSEKTVTLRNYADMAKTIRGNLEHNVSLDQMIDGFKWIQGEARTGVRTESHRNVIEKAVEKWDHGGLSKLVPPELVAGAASVALQLTRKGASAIGLGAIAGGVVAAAKESNRVETDFAERMREKASGLEVSAATKYDQQLNEALVKMDTARSLTVALDAALSLPEDHPKRKSELMKALATADARVSRSDSTGYDVIAYSDPSKIEEERFALDLARAKARALVDDRGKGYQDKYERADNEYVVEHRSNLMDESRQALNKLKVQRALKAGVITAGSILVTAKITELASAKIQEMLAQGTEVSDVSIEELSSQGSEDAVREISELSSKNTMEFTEISDNETMLSNNTEIVSRTDSYTIEEYSEKFGTNVHRLGWAKNGENIQTAYNEAGNGLLFNAKDLVETTNGEMINISEQVEDGKIFAYVSLSKDTQMSPIKIPGIMNEDGSIEFIPEEGSVAAELFENGKFIGKYAEIAIESGAAEDGAENIIPLATMVGEGVSGEVTETITEEVSEVASESISAQLTESMAETTKDAIESMDPAMPSEIFEDSSMSIVGNGLGNIAADTPLSAPLNMFGRSEMTTSTEVREANHRTYEEEVASIQQAVQNVIEHEENERGGLSANNESVSETDSRLRNELGDFGYELITQDTWQDPYEIWQWLENLSIENRQTVFEMPLAQIQNRDLRDLLEAMR